jgi:hypothetical protein
MEKETALALLKIAAQLTASVIESGAKTRGGIEGSPFLVEAVFDDCLHAVQIHFETLTHPAN